MRHPCALACGRSSHDVPPGWRCCRHLSNSPGVPQSPRGVQAAGAAGDCTCSGRTPTPTMRAGIRCSSGTRLKSRNIHGGASGCVLLSTGCTTRFCASTCIRCVTRRRELAPLLHAGEIVLRERPVLQRLPQQVGGGHRVLDREIDADAAHGRHGVRGVADAQQPRPVPRAQPVDARRSSSLTSSHDFSSSTRVARNGSALATVCRNAGSPACLDALGVALGDHVGELEVVAAVEHGEEAAGRDAPAEAGIAGAARDAHPEHVDGRADVLDLAGRPWRAPSNGGRRSRRSRRARTSSGPSGVVARTPTTRPRSSMRSMTFACMSSWKFG